MKRVKKLTFLVTALIMLFAMAVSGLGYVFAAPANGTTSGNQYVQDAVNLGQMPTEVTYGGNVTLPSLAAMTGYSYVVTSPLQKDLTAAEFNNYQFTAKYLGTYNVQLKHTGSGSFYDSFKVKVVYKDEPFMEVDDNGADIPTYIKTGNSFTLPGATVYILNDDGDKVSVQPQPAITKSVTGPNGLLPIVDGKYTIPAEGAGKYYVRYTFKQHTAGAHEDSKDFTINAQKDFKDDVDPVLSPGSVALEYYVRTAVTLPTATATDNFDTNVRINVRVTGPDGLVKEAVTYTKEIKSNSGDASSVKYTFVDRYLETAQVFKNHDSKSMTFYPEKVGRYKVQYWAVDDNGNGLMNADATTDRHDISNAKNPTLFEFDVTDTQPPRFLFTNDQKADIPTVWSVSLESANSVKFPVPLIIDNLDGSNENYTTATADRKIRLDFAIKDPNGTQVLSITDIYAASDKNIFVKDGVFQNKGEYKFGSIIDRAYGDYTITYTVRDAANNIGTESYKITLSSDLASVFTKAPKLTINDVAKFIKLDANQEGELAFPQYTVKDDYDTKVKVEVEYVLGKDGVFGTTPVRFDDVLKLNAAGGDGYVNITDKNQIKITIKAINDYGIEKEADPVIVKIINPSVSTSTGVSTVASANNTSTKLTESTIEKNLDKTFNQHITAELGRFVAKIDAEDEFSGVTMIVRDESEDNGEGKGDILTKTKATYINYYDGTDTYIIVDKISFKPTRSGWHSITFVCTTVDNKVLVQTYYIDVKPNDDGTWTDKASYSAVPPREMEMGQAYLLPNKVRTDSQGALIEGMVAYTIEGPLFTLNNYEFIPKSLVYDYSVIMTYVETTSAEPTGKTYEWGNYPITAQDKDAPVIKIVTPLQFYSKKFVGSELDALTAGSTEYNDLFKAMTVRLPEVSAIDNNDITKIEYEVYNKNSKAVEVLTHADGYKYFKPEIDGRYTINIKVSDSRNTSTMTLYVSAGDIIPPTLTIATEDNIPTSVKKDYKFYFERVEVEDNTSIKANITVVKTLLGPNKEELLRVTTLAGDDYVKLEKVGTYTVIYTATDEAGNESRREFTISVTSSSKGVSIPLQTLSTILIIAAVLLLIGVVVYFIRYRRVESAKRI